MNITELLIFEPNTTSSIEHFFNIPQNIFKNVYNAHSVASLEEGIEKLKTLKYDMIIVDLSISNEENIDNFLSLLDIYSELPVILLMDQIGELDNPISRKIEKFSNVEYLIKDKIDAYLLKRTIDLIIEKKAVQQEANDFIDNISSAILDTQDEERKRFARDLHDGLGQKLSALSMNMKALSKDVDNNFDNNTKHIYEKCLLLIENISLELRGVAHDMIPPELNVGLCKAIKNMCRMVNDTQAVKINVDADDDIKLEKKVEIELYRIIQELFNNSLKHSNAEKIDIKLCVIDNNLYLSFKDDGMGIKNHIFSNGIGLKSIKKRVGALNGKFSFKNEHNKGCCIKVSIPL